MATRILPRRLRKMPLVAEEPSILPVPDSYNTRRRNFKYEEEQQNLYQRRMEKLKKTLENMGDQPKGASRSRELSQEHPKSRNQREITQMSRRSSSSSPLKLSTKLDSTLTMDHGDTEYDINQLSIRSLNGTRSSRDTRTADGTPIAGGQYQSKYRTKGILKKKKRRQFLKTFKKLTKFVCILLGLWRKHANKVQDFLETSVNLVSVDAINDLLFDKTDYTADKQARISMDTKRILCMLPEQRTEQDIRYVEVALRNYPSIAGYPVSIQNLIASKAWYEIYEGRRIIIRQGHVARCFYFILSGTAVITKMEEDSNKSKTVCYLNKGDSFGEAALINNTTRSATVISEGTVEFLVVTDEDYEEIFTSGEITEKYDSFFSGLSYLRGWPIEILANNVKKAFITYFKRGAVMTQNSSQTEWIYIVKSGSVTVLKKLKEPAEDKRKQKALRKRKIDALNEDEHLSYLCNAIVRETKKLNRKEMVQRFHRLKELHLGAHVSGPSITSTTPAKDHHLDPIDKVVMVNTQPQPTQVEIASRMKKLSGWQIGPMVTRTGITPRPPVGEDIHATVNSSRPVTGARPVTGMRPLTGDYYGGVDGRRMSDYYGGVDGRRMSGMSTDLQQLQITQAEDSMDVPQPDSFVTVQTLTKGDSFGIAELIHGQQPDFSLVSNGSECIMIEKKLYWDQATESQELMRRLKNEILPYPTDEKMQGDLGITLNWAKHKHKVFHKALRLAHKRKKISKMKAKGMAICVDR